jgi:hypothetical protein
MRLSKTPLPHLAGIVLALATINVLGAVSARFNKIPELEKFYGSDARKETRIILDRPISRPYNIGFYGANFILERYTKAK